MSRESLNIKEMYNLGLLAKSFTESLEEKISIFCLLDLAEEAYQKYFHDDIRFTN